MTWSDIAYSPLGEAPTEEDRRRERRMRTVLGIWVSVLVLVCVVVPREAPSSQWAGDKHEHTIPTPLSVVNPETGRYLYALHNPLYEELKTASFREEELPLKATPNTRRRTSQQQEAPRVWLDQEEIAVRQPLTLSWTLGRQADGSTPVLTDDDIVALYCPANEADHRNFREAATLSQVRATHVKHAPKDVTDDDSEEHRWHIPSFPILRQETCEFRIWKRSDDEALHLVATSPLFKIPDSSRTPTAIHMAYDNDPSVVNIQFNTGASGTPVAMYGKDSADTKVEGTSHTYAASNLCQEPANATEVGKFIPPGMLHVVTLTDLELDTTYKYKVGLAGGQGIVWSDVYTIHSAPAVGTDRPFAYVTYGDQGCPDHGWGNGGELTAALAKRELDEAPYPIQSVHHFGDLSYARGAAHIWDEWFHMISIFTARIPLMVGVGNHEYDHTDGGDKGKDPSGLETPHGFMPAWGNFGDDSSGECGVPTARRFKMPANGNGVFWYSHDYMTVHTVMISSEHDLRPGSPQYQWLEADLKAVDRTITPWLIVETHRPLYESEAFWDQTAVSIGLRYEVEDLFHQYGVDMILAGHYHAYLRTCDGLYRSKCDNGGPVHITVGSAGAQLDNGTLYEQDWTESFLHEFGYGRVTVMNSTALHFEFVSAQNETAGDIHDDVWILRER